MSIIRVVETIESFITRKIERFGKAVRMIKSFIRKKLKSLKKIDALDIIIKIAFILGILFFVAGLLFFILLIYVLLK
jgi:hypothetical protein